MSRTLPELSLFSYLISLFWSSVIWLCRCCIKSAGSGRCATNPHKLKREGCQASFPLQINGGAINYVIIQSDLRCYSRNQYFSRTKRCRVSTATIRTTAPINRLFLIIFYLPDAFCLFFMKYRRWAGQKCSKWHYKYFDLSKANEARCMLNWNSGTHFGFAIQDCVNVLE